MSLLLLGTILILTAAAAPPAVETAATAVRWDEHGGLAGLTDKPGGTEFPGAAKPGPLYGITLADGAGEITSLQADRVDVRRDGPAVVFEGQHRQAGLTVRGRFAPLPDSPLVAARIAVEFHSPQKLAEVRFPIVQLALPLGRQAAEERLVLPYCDGCLIQGPLTRRREYKLSYPGVASMQMLAAYQPAAGVYLACQDSQGYAKSFLAAVRDQVLELSVTHLSEQTPGSQWAVAYDTVLGTFRGRRGPGTTGWEDAADLYRAWAVRQPWCRETLAARLARGDVPRWLAQPSLFYCFSLQGFDAQNHVVNRLPMLADQARRWREAIGAPVTLMLMGWEKRGTWVTPDYFPPLGGEEAFRTATAELHAQGHHTQVFLSGLKWTLQKRIAPADRPPTEVDTEAEFNRRARPFAISDEHGAALIAGKPDEGVGRYGQVCPTTPLGREILLGSSLKCNRLGIDCVQADQIVGGGLPPCLHPEHAHPPGGGRWCAASLYERFAEIRREGRRQSAELAFAIEEPGEFFIPVLDLYHARDYQQNRWPRSGPDVLGVPLFTHVYHDYLLGYGGDSPLVSQAASTLALYHQGMNLVCGKSAAASVWSRWLDPLAVDPAQLRLLRGHMDLWRGPAGEFLVAGRRVAGPALDVPPVEIVFTDKSQSHRRLSVPSVLHGVWELPDGRRGAVLACLGPQRVEFEAFGQKFSLEAGETAWRMLPGGAADGSPRATN